MKRELERISGASSVDVDSPRAKRRKETAQAAMPANTSKSNNVASDTSAIKFKHDALSLWSTIKDATNKECGFPFFPVSRPFLCLTSRRRGRLLSTEFLRLPSKRQYADYFQQIQNPIALDEIKSRIESGKYPNLDAVRLDLELCFKNAKKYNMKDSPIWKDAKHLHVRLRL
jgi:chromatin structure-remodeling complex subunit RSC4